MSRNQWLYAFVASVLVQSAILYSPRSPGVPAGFPWDKVVHLGIFAVVAAIGLRAGVPTGWLVAGLVAQAFASEFIQGWLLPHRSGDVRDVAADLAGVAVGLVLGVWWQRDAAAAGHPPLG